MATIVNCEWNPSSASTVKRRRKELGIYGSRTTAKTMPLEEAEQLILDELGRDPSKHSGVKNLKIQHKVAFNTGRHIAKYVLPQICIHVVLQNLWTYLPRHIVSDVMHVHDPEGFSQREPTSKKNRRFPKYPVGIHERWSAMATIYLYYKNARGESNNRIGGDMEGFRFALA